VLHEILKLERIYKQFVNVFAVGYCDYLVYRYYCFFSFLWPMWLLRLSFLLLLLWLLLFEWIENIIKYFMYSEFENLCKNKLGFVSFPVLILSFFYFLIRDYFPRSFFLLFSFLFLAVN
jgi:hypothetical protein